MRQKKNQKKTLKDYYETKYSKSIADARPTNTDETLIDEYDLKTSQYSLKGVIKRSPWLKSGRPSSKAMSWLYQTVFKDPTKYRWSKQLMAMGNFYCFEYKNPKFKDTLEYFDKYPLVLSLGPIPTKEGIRNLGFNLHLLPSKVRLIVICQIFEFFKRLYRYQIFYKKTTAVNIKYDYIINKLRQYSVEFCVRLYIPSRMRVIVRFPYNEWHKAIFIPSRGYSSIRSQALIKKWRAFNRAKGFRTNPNISWQGRI